ncbi:DUF4864 domain-containing protein [Rhodobacteraceae bacterium]|nr:DUF4864 domain-containing protein [Paracoccaceae bacterium]
MLFHLRILGALIAFTWASVAVAQDVLVPEPDIEATIGAQIEAFRADDFAKAFSYASPNIQGMFGSHERFGQMVQNGFPMVWRPGVVQFLELREVAGALWQRVQIRDQAGKFHALDYQMIQEGGGWRINAVQIVPLPDVGA